MADYSGAYGGRRDTADADGASQREPLCPICMAILRNQAVGTPECCDHRFCLSCLREWAKSVNTCPIDRQPFNIIRCQSTAKSDGSCKTIYVDNRKLPSADDPTYCEVCKRCNLENQLLLCDGCDRGFHLRCLNPPLNAVPHGEWYCTRCLRIISSAMRSRTVRTSTSPNASSSTDGDDGQGSRRACRRGGRKGGTASVVVQGTAPIGQRSGRRTSAGGRVAHVQPEVSETCPTDNANSSERAEASDKDESDLDDSDENYDMDDDDSDEDYHPRSVKLNRRKPRSSTNVGRGKRGRAAPNRSARGRLAGNRRGMGRKSTGNVKPDSQRHRIAKDVQSFGKAKEKEKKKAKKSATTPLVKKSSVVLRPLQLAARSQRLDRGSSSGSIYDTETAGNCTSNDEATQPGPSCSRQAIVGTGIVDHRSPLSSIGDARGNAECSDDACVSSSEECPPLLQEADVPILRSTRSPPLLDMQCDTVGACKTPACDPIANQKSSSTTVSRISRLEKAECRSKSRACDRSGSSSTAAVASSASSNFWGRMANVPAVKKTKIMNNAPSTSKGSGGGKLCAPVSIVLRLGMPEMAGRSMQAAGGRSVAADNAPPVSVMNEAYDRQSLSDGQVSVSSSPGSPNRLPLSADTPCDNQQYTVANEPCIVGTTEAKITALALVSECAERVPTSFCEHSSNDKPALGDGTASAILAAPVTLGSHSGDHSAAESRCRSVSQSCNDGISHLSSRKSPPASTDSRLAHSERTVPAALGTAPPCVTTFGGVKAACSDAPGTSRRNVTADGNTLAESSQKLALSFKKVRRGPRTPSPPPPPSSDDDDHRSRSPVRHRKRPSFTSLSTTRTECSPGSAADAKAAPSALPVADGGADKRLSAPKVTTEHKHTSPATETPTAGPQSALNCRRPEHGCTKAAAEQGNEIDSHECVRLSEASGVSKSSVVRSTVARETVILNRVYRGYYRDGLDESDGYTGSAYGHSSGGFIARHRASDARSNRGFDRLSDSFHSRTADRYAIRDGTYRERYMPTAQPGWLSARRAARQDERCSSIKVPDNFNGPLLPHSDMRQTSSRSQGLRRPPLLLDRVAAVTAERLGRVPHFESQPLADGHSWTMSGDDHGVENEEWVEGGNGDVDCEAFMDRYESGEGDYYDDYEGYYEDDGGDYEFGGDYYEADYDGGEIYYDDNGIYYDDNEIYYDDNGIYYEQMTSVNEYQSCEYLGYHDPADPNGEVDSQWTTGGYDGAETRRGSFSAGWPFGRDLPPQPAGSARLFPGRDARRGSWMPVPGAVSSSRSSSQWLADWLQMNTMQSIPSATPDLARASSSRESHESPHLSADAVYRGASRFIPRGQSVRGVRGNASLLDSPAAASSYGSRGLLDPYAVLPSSWFGSVTTNIQEQQWRPPIRGEMDSLPRDPRVRPDRVESSRASVVPAAALRRCGAAPSSASAAGFTHKMGNRECSGSMPTGKGSQSLLVPEAGSGADTRGTNISGTSTAAAEAEIPESRDGGGSPMSLSSECSPSGATSPDRFSLVSVAVSRTPSPSAFACEQGQSMFGSAHASSVIASAASTTGSTIAGTSSVVVTVGRSAAAASMVPLAVTPAKTEDPKVREIAVIVERHLMGPHMTGRIDTVTYKAIAKKAVFKIYKQEKGSKLDESRIQKLVEAYVREADLPNMPRLK